MKAFTLIELLIVIVIIGILATSLIPRVQGIQNKAKYTRVQKDFQDFSNAVFLAQSNTQKTLREITGSAYTAGSCTSGTPNYIPLPDIHNLPESHNCKARFRLALERIAVAAGMQSGALLSMALDPRGRPYLLDENEGEHGSDGCGSKDSLRSWGSDGIYGSEDDRSIRIAPIRCSGTY